MASAVHLGLFGNLPLEIRRKIYCIVFQGQVIHCCSSKGHSCRHGIARAASPLSPCSAKAFEKECLECCESDFEPAIGAARVARWSSIISYGDSLFTPADYVSLFLACRTFWDEAEPLMWSSITLNIGIPQFGAFHNRFLQDSRNTHFVRRPRGQLLRCLQIIVPNNSKLASAMGLDFRFNHLSSHYVVSTGIDLSIAHLAACTELKSVSLITAASLAIQGPDPELRLLHFNVINLMFRLPIPLSKFRMVYIGQLRDPSRPHGDNYDDLPDSDPCKRKLSALASVLAQHILGEISLEHIPESNFLDEDDPGVIELQAHVQRYLEGKELSGKMRSGVF